MANRRMTGRTMAAGSTATASSTLPVPPTGTVARRAATPNFANELAQSALRKQAITLNIPAGSTLAQVEAGLQHVINAVVDLNAATEMISPMIGKFLYYIDLHRLYRPDYKNITDYINRRVEAQFGLKATRAFEMKRVAAADPSLTEADIKRYGATRLLTASSITDASDTAHWKPLLEKSLTMTVTDFAAYAKDVKRARANGGDATAIDSVVLSFRVPSALRDTWHALVDASGMSSVDLFTSIVEDYAANNPTTADATMTA